MSEVNALSKSDSVALKQRLAGLSANQRALLARRLSEDKSASASSGESRAIPRARPVRVEEHPRVAVYPASRGQQRMWFLHHYAPESPVYSVPSAFHLAGPLNVGWLEAAFRAVIQRHDMLRTTFAMENSELFQRVAASSAFELQQINLEGMPADTRKAAAERCLAEESCRPFDLAVGPPFRAVLVRLQPEEHVLLVVLHHIISDGWSRSNLCRELSAAYEALVTGRPPPVSELPVQFADYSAWQKNWLESGILEEQIAYWKTKLAGEPEALDLPSDRPRPASESFRGDRCSMRLDPALTAVLKTRAQEEGATLFMILLAAFKTLLHRYTGHDDLIVGVPIANRQRVEVEGLIGFFVNTLVMRTSFSGDPTFRELLRRVKETAVEAYASQDMPFERLVDLLQIRRDASRTPLFQASFALQDYPEVNFRLPGLQTAPWFVTTHTSKFDFSMTLERSAEGWTAAAEYSTDLFDADRVERMLEHWRVILENVVANPTQRVSEIQLLSAAERQKILVEWNQTERDYPRDKCVHQLFEEQVERTPEAVAVVFQGQSLTYWELNARANQFGHHLRSLGVGPDVLVGLCMERSLDMIVSLLGILKAGAAYVPLDPSYPRERLAFIMADAALPILVTQSPLLPKLPESAAQFVCFDTSRDEIFREDAEEPVSGVGPENLAYVIYTSGSTGQPKGVLVQHRSLCNVSEAQVRAFHPMPGDRVLQFASISFDASIFEIVMALRNGAALCLGCQDELMPGPGLVGFLRDREVTIVTLPPSGLSALPAAQLPALRVVTVAGEACREELVEQWAPGRRFFNLYGPTETTIWATMAECHPGNIRPPIGRPIINTQVYVLDRHLSPVPAGVAGELFIGGEGLARGYLNAPDLTAEKFIADPFSPAPGARLYKTGDLARYLPDGNIEFIGRLDHQVKIRGYRVELGEIEAVLGGHPEVASCAVVARDHGGGDKTLAAFVVVREQADLSVEVLRQWLSEKLPDYMIPSRFVAVPALPLTPNGKVDRKGLEETGGVELAIGSDYVAPRNELECELAKIWQAVLGRDRVGIHDNFFDLGGHSLLAVRAVSRMSGALGVDVSLRMLFEFPTLAGLAGTLSASQSATASLVPPLVPVARDGPLPLSFAQERLWFLDRLEMKSAAYHMPEALRLRGDLKLDALERAINEIVARHESLRTYFVEVDGKPAQVIAPTLKITLPVQDLSALEDEAREAAIVAALHRECEEPFDLSQVPLLRVTLIKLGDREHILLRTFHHIVSDGWSVVVFNRELATFYEAFCGGRDNPLEPLVVQYPDYALWQRRWLQGKALDRLLAYWTNKLEGAPALLGLPTDRPRAVERSNREDSRTLDLPDDLACSLLTLCQREHATLFMALLAAFKVLLARYSGQEDIVVGTAIAARDRVETDGLIGLFVSTVALRTDLSGNPTFTELLKRVRTTALEAFEHQDLPFEKLVEKLHPDRSLSHNPVFNVFFNMPGLEELPPSLAGLEVERLAMPERNAKFDITLYAISVGDRLGFRIAYNQALFHRETIERMLGQWQYLLTQVAEGPHRPIQDYSLVTSKTMPLLPNPAVALPEPLGVPVFRQFLAVAEVHGAQPAVRHDGRDWTYRQLENASQQIAKQLVASGVGSGDVVVVSGQRSFGLVAGILAVLRARGILLLIDPSLPSERRDRMLQEAHGRHWLRVDDGRDGDGTWSAAFLGLPTTRVSSDGFCLEPSRESAREDVVLADAAPEEPAYIFFTSGTTGKPKAIVGDHKGLSHFIDWERQILGIVQNDCVAQLTSLSFDVVLRDIFLPLTSGATLCLPGAEIVSQGDLLVSWLRRESISILHAVPSLAHAWLDSLPSEMQVPSLRWVLFAGEPLTGQLVLRWRKQIGGMGGMINLYGPTETTLAKCFYILPKNPGAGVQPIGQPLPFTQALVINSNNQICGIGERGEIAIRTPFRTRGYLNGSDSDRARFVRNPFRNDPSDLIYRTGDIGAYDNDGNLLIFGRCDDQLKVRGARVEPGEITATLAEHGDIRRSVVMVCEDSPGDKRLVAYILPVDVRSAPGVEELRNFLKQKLPDYMIPSRFVLVRSFPLTPNGKVDRKALQKMDGVELAVGTEYVAPRNTWECKLMEIWQTVLRQNRVGIQDNFFELGGHSLLAVQAVSRMRTALEVDLPLRMLFEFPTIAGLAGKLLASRGATSSLVPPLVTVTRDGPWPLSFAQQRLWFLDRLDGKSVAYHMTEARHLRGDLKKGALERAINEIVARHESLRTHFVEVEGEPVQIVAPSVKIALPVEDLTALKEDAKEEAITTVLRREREGPFDLSQGPLLRMTLIKLGEREHILLRTFHHIVSDGWSVGVFNRELGVLYESFREERDNPLEPLVMQYRDYALWQRGWLQGKELERQLAYWRHQLADAPNPGLPTDRTRPARQTYAGARHTFVISPALSAQLKVFNRAKNITPFMSLMAAFQVLLARYSGQDDILVGTPIANRQKVELENLIGFFVNTLALRTDLSGQPDFREVVDRVRKAALDAYENQDLPFEKLVEELNPRRDPSRHPLFQVMFTLQNAPTHPLTLAGMEVAPFRLPADSTRFDLELHLRAEGDTWAGVFSYNTDLFDAATIERMAGHYQTLLEAMLADPERPVSELPILTATERHQILVEWNRTEREYPRDKCVHQLFEEQVKLTPEAVAVVFEGTSLTYRELNARANQLAHCLHRLGVGRESPVALFLERSLEMVVGIFGTLKAGGVYVPIDPTYPSDRVAFMLRDASVSVILTHEKLREKLPENPAQVVYLDRESPVIERESEESSPSGVDAGDLAYVIYTSGSTGRPKGVAVEHRQVATYLRWAGETYCAREGSGVPVQSALAFDLTVTSLLLPLVNGRTVFLLPEEGAVAAFADALRQNRDFSFVKITPPHLEALDVLLGDADVSRSTRSFIVGGEPFPPSLAARWRRRVPQARFINEYGPTEATVGCCIHEVSPADEASGSIPIGQAVPGTQLYVLDRGIQLVPVGVVGELFIGGAQVGRGYWKRPELTAERFVPDPFRGDPNARLYRTGDRCRWLPDGRLDFLGRLDDQVKVRGFRVELGEIEAVLAGHPRLTACAVLPRQSEAGEKYLAGFVVVRDGRKLTAASLREWLGARLPDYMIPSRFVLLPALPLTPNGKVDRKALEKLDGVEVAAGTDYVDPRNERERKLVEIWQAALRRTRVGIQDNFFDLGGHSLLAVVINSRISRLFGFEVPLRWVFEHPTIEGLAKRMESLERDPQNTRPIEKADRREPLPMSFAQQQMWLLQQMVPDPATYNVRVACRLSGVVDPERIRRSLQVILERHEVLRTALVQQGGSLVQQIANAKDVPLPWQQVSLSAMPPSQRQAVLEQRLMEDACRPFDLAQAPLWRVLWLECDADEHVLAFTFHHGIMDEWSLRLFLQEWTRLYAANGCVELAGLPELPVQYADYAVWQRQRLTGELLERQRNYWRAILKDLPPALELPTDRARPVQPSGRGAVHHFQLTGPIVTRLRELARENETTLFSVLLAGFQVWLHRYTGQTDVVVGTPVARRERTEVQSLIGYFLNTLPVRTRLDGSSSFCEVLRQLRESLLDAFGHADLPFEQMVEMAVKERDPGQHLIYQVMFVLLEEAPAWCLDQIEIQQLPLETRTSKNDLTLSVRAVDEIWDCRIEYATDLFSADTAGRMACHLTELFRSIADDPKTSVSQLNLMPEEERRQVLVEWNRTERDYPYDKCVHQLFEEQVERTPDAVAVVFEGHSLTYRELNARANRLAHHLRSLGAGPDVLVGLCVERSIEMVVALLGILKAGGACMPLDPTLPQQRLAFLMSDAACAVVITQNSLLPLLKPEQQAPGKSLVWIVLDRMTSELPPGDERNPVPVNAPDHLVYVLYTSGSTGQPKGVEMPHRALVNLVHWQCSTSAMRSGNRTLQFASLGFDVSFQEIFSTWISGGTLVLVAGEIRRDPAALLSAMDRWRIERAFLPFVMLEQMAEMAEKRNTLPRDLKEVLVAGEQLRIGPGIRRFFDRMPGCRLWNHYGPTESHVVTAYELVGAPSDWPDLPPIGRPLANCQIYLLDAQKNPVPLGTFGDLFIGGVCLSRGYRQHPELTEQRYLPSPFSHDPEQRLYRTGDLCRWRADGHVEYLGRLDQQIKIRGYRVELGEIETVLCEMDGVREAVVVVRGDAAGEKRLVAYVVTDANRAKDESGLKTALKARLPDFMIPMHIEFLSALPLTPNGKVDRRALPEPTKKTSASREGAMLPRNLLELELTRLWQQLFQRKDIGREHNFFALGGHSLLATRLAAEIDHLLGCKLPIAALFQSPTIESLAQRLTEKNWAPPWSSLVPLQPLGSKPPLFFVHGWGGDVYWFLELAQLIAPDQPIYGLQAVGLDGKAERHTTVEGMAAHYVREIRSLQPEGPYYLAGYSMGGLVAFEIAQQLYQHGERVALLGLLDTSPRSAPWTVYGRTLAPIFWQRCQFHLRRWREMPKRDRLGYIRRCWNGLQWWIARNRRKPPVVATPPEKGSQPPQVPGFEDYYWAVASAYRLRRYPGSIDVFLSDSANPALFSFWGHLARGGAVLHRVPGKHLEIVEPDRLPALAKTFRTALERAQQNANFHAKVGNSHASSAS